MAEKFPHVDNIAWGKIREIRVQADKKTGSYSFEFDLHGRKQKMLVTVTPSSTSYTLSSKDGNPILHATQQGKEVKIIDFTAKPNIRGAAAKIRKIGKIKKK